MEIVNDRLIDAPRREIPPTRAGIYARLPRELHDRLWRARAYYKQSTSRFVEAALRQRIEETEAKIEAERTRKEGET